MRLALHPFVWAHLPELTDLWVASWAATMPEIDFDARRPWLVEHLRALHETGVDIVCAFDETNGAMAGFVTIDPRTGHLDQIAVARQARGSGAAQALLDEAKRRAPGRVRLDVNAANPRAVAFYLREGFRKVGEGVNPRSGLATIDLEWRAAATG